jgi:hypothetical protein
MQMALLVSSSLGSTRAVCWGVAAMIFSGFWLASGLCSGWADEAAAKDLFNGRDLAGWRKPATNWISAGAVALDVSNPEKFSITAGTGILVNGREGRAPDLVTEEEFGDVELHVEFCLPRHSNSGVYLMGRYEVQVYDSFGVEQDKYPGIECGGIYPRFVGGKKIEGHSPKVNASKVPGEWQTFDIVFRAPRFDAGGQKIENARMVSVKHNGQLVQENIEVTGPTWGGFEGEERAAGPLRLQGDHGPIAYRNLRLRSR